MIKRNKYILLTAITIFAIILLQMSAPAPTGTNTGISLIPSVKTFLESPFTPLFILFFFLYLFLAVIGIANLIFFAAAKLLNRPLVNIQEPAAEFPLTEEKSAKLLLLVSSFVLAVYLIEISISNLAVPISKISLINLAVFLNLVLEITIITAVVKFMRRPFLMPNPKIYLGTLLRIYTAMLPLIFAAVLISNFLLEKTAAAPAPIIEIILLSKNKLLTSLILFQVTAAGPIAEEIFFRGFIYKLLRTRHSFFLSAVFVSIIFALIHGSAQDTIPLFVISCGICYAYEKTQNILSPIILHSLHNTINIAVLMLLKNLI